MDSAKSKPVERRSQDKPSPRGFGIFQNFERAQQYVDRHVQGGLISRMAIHWGLFFFTTAFAYVIVQVIVSPNGNSFLQRMQAAVADFSLLGLLMLTLLPAFMLDVIRFSNRFAGPMVRLRRFLRELGENGEVPVLNFRDDDFWTEVAREFNLCRDRVLKQRLEIDRLRTQLNEYRLNLPPTSRAVELLDQKQSLSKRSTPTT